MLKNKNHPRKWIFLLLTFFLIFSFVNASKSIKPFKFKLADYPQDDGDNVVINWTHYASSPLQNYKILRGKHKDSLKPRQMKNVLDKYKEPKEDEHDVSDKDFYLTTKDQEGTQIDKIICAKGDSLKDKGKKVIRYELVVPPSKYDQKPVEYVEGEYYAVSFSKEEMNKPNIKSIEGEVEKSDSGSIEVSKGKQKIKIGYKKPTDEREFLKQNLVIYRLTPKNKDFLRKYGRRIAAFVTKDKRYSLRGKEQVFRDNIGLKAGETYYYKIVGMGGGIKAETEVKKITPKDEPPAPAVGLSCMIDSVERKAFINWRTQKGQYCSKVKIFKTNAKDTALTEGELIAELPPSWHSIKYEFEEDDTLRGHKFYIESYDKAGNKTKSKPFKGQLSKLKYYDFPPGLELVEPKNDKDGNQLAFRWDPISLQVKYKVRNAQEKKAKYKKIPLEKQYYFITNISNAPRRIIPKSKLDSISKKAKVAKMEWLKVPVKRENARKVVSVLYERKWKYSKTTHEGISQAYGFVRAKVDDQPWRTDREESGSFIFKDISPGTHRVRVVMLKSSGTPFENPETKFDKKIDLSDIGPGFHGQERHPYYYEIYRFSKGEDKTNAELIGKAPASDRIFVDRIRKDITDKKFNYFMRVVSARTNAYKESKVFGPLSPEGEWFNTGKVSILVLLLILFSFVIYFITHARRGKEFYIRPIPGIKHVDEALGRATEMGKPALFILGLAGVSNIATIAGLTVLSRVQKRAAKFGTRVIVPCRSPLVYLVAQETVKNACAEAGRPDAFNEDDVYFVTRGQFAYAAAVNGIMIREDVATNFYMGKFYAESLLFSETGARSGAIQIAGTDSVTQIPFFITTCDYTLIGEELYAASAYLSDDPKQVGSMKAQDYTKAIILLVMILGIFFITFNMDWFYFILSI